MLLSAGQVSDYKGLALMIGALHRANALLAYRGYDAGLVPRCLAGRGIATCIPSQTNRKRSIPRGAGPSH